MKQKLIPVISIAIGILAFFLTLKYTRDKALEFKRMKEEFYQGAARVTVVAASRDIPGGTMITGTDIMKAKVYKINVGDRAVDASDGVKIIGKKVLFPIKEGDPVFWSDIDGGNIESGGLATLVKAKMRAISLSVGGANAVSGMVRPNDRVDVLGTFSFPSKTVAGEMETVTLTVLQDVTILATGDTTARQRGGSSRANSGFNTVTLSVTPREAELLVFAEQMQGRLTLSLRNPSDLHFEADTPEVNFEHLTSKLKEYNIYRQKYIRFKKTISR